MESDTESDQSDKHEKITHALVKFRGKYDRKENQVVSVKNIVEFMEQAPKSEDDFNNQILYKLMWTDEKNPEGVINCACPNS